MAFLTKEQTGLIRNFIIEKGIAHPDLQDDLLDHICSAIETRMDSGDTFDKAYTDVMNSFGEKELKSVQTKTQALLDGRKIFYPGIRQSLGMSIFFFALYFFGYWAIIRPIVQFNLHFFEQNAILLNNGLICGCMLLVIAYARMELTERGFVKVDIFPHRPVPISVYPLSICVLLVSGLWLEIISQWIPKTDSFYQLINFILIYYTPVSAFVYSVLLFPLLSEIFFRGIILKGMLRKHTPIKAIVVSSLFFACTLNPYLFIAYFFMGLFCGWLFYQTHSLIPSMAVQSITGLLSFTQIFFFKPKTYDQLFLWKHFFQNEVLYYSVGALGLLLTVFLLWRLKKIFSQQPPVALLSME